MLWWLAACLSSSTEAPLAQGVKIDKITWNQGSERVLRNTTDAWAGGEVPPPYIADRDALVRVYLGPDDEATATAPERVEVHIAVGEQAPHIVEIDPTAPWRDADLDTTASVRLAADDLDPGAILHVSVRDPQGEPGSDEAVVRRRVQWASDPLDLVPTDVLRITIVPYTYEGRTPDVPDALQAEIGDHMFAWFPASAVEVTVADPVPWTEPLPADDGAAWDAVLADVSARRGDAEVPPNTYFYALVKPADTFEAYCAGHDWCFEGRAMLPEDGSEPWQRVGMGIAFGDIAATLGHEIGHAHGRRHAPCGRPGGPDPAYPYVNAQLGAIGYHLVTGELIPEQGHRDVMSYCPPYWVSDHTFTALRRRIAQVARQARSTVPHVDWQAILVAADGSMRQGPVVRAPTLPGGTYTALEGGAEGWFTPYADGGGGLLLVRD